MQTVAVGWQVYEVTRDPLDLGLIGLSQFLPFIALILPAGHLADSRDRRRILSRSATRLDAVCALLLLAFALRGMTEARAGVRRHDAVRRCARIRRCRPARRCCRTSCRASSSARRSRSTLRTWQIATIAGPALGGMIYLAGAPVVYASAAGLFALAIAMTLLLRARRIAGTAAPSRRRLATLLAGLQVRTQPPRRCSAQFRSTSSLCCSVALPRCCRCMRPTCFTLVRTDWAGCARRRRSAPRPAASS